MKRGRGRPKGSLSKTITQQQIVSDELIALHKKHKTLSPSIIVQSAKRKKSPLHNLFDWDDTEASQKWRLHQARILIVNAKITVVKNNPTTIKAFVSLRDKEERKYMHTAQVMEDKALQLQLFTSLENRIQPIQDHLQAFGILTRSAKTALTSAKKPITRKRMQLQKVKSSKKVA